MTNSATAKGTMRTIDLTNNDGISVGYRFMGEQGYLAVTFTESKWFKTERGAIAWLARRGYDSTGSRK